jgi:hypothetical protein
MLVGSFEMDFEDGQINFKTSYPFPKGQLDAELLKRVVGFNLDCMDKYLPAIMSVIYAGASPAKALAALEREQKAKATKRACKPPGQHRRFINN